MDHFPADCVNRSLLSWDSFDKSNEDADESEVLKLKFFEMSTDPWDLFRHIDMKIEEELQKIAERNRTKEPQFAAGRYRDHSSTVHFGSWWPTESMYLAWRVCDIVGIPIRADHIIIMGPRLRRAEALSQYRYSDSADYLRLLRVAQSEGDEHINQALGRIQVARLSSELVAYLNSTILQALEFGLPASPCMMVHWKISGSTGWILFRNTLATLCPVRRKGRTRAISEGDYMDYRPQAESLSTL